METSNALAEMNKIMGLHDGYDNWKRDVSAYVETKKNFQGVAEPYHKVTNAHVKAQEVQYNPITQTFTNPQRESQIRDIEAQKMVDVLAQNKVRAPSSNIISR